ncbi:MAG: HEAT repeat domain-containing protein [Pirellulales bacterium]|nr:HEAT repeat domain-containing protein [Pirellulales bacterium]
MRGASEGLATTFRVLTNTASRAAGRVLLAALDSPHESIQDRALIALLARRSRSGGRQILLRLHTMPERWIEIIRQHHVRMTRALRDAVLGNDRQLFLNACRAAVWFREYDLIPTLLSALGDLDRNSADVVAETILELTDQLYAEVTCPRDEQQRRDPQLVQQHIVSSLETSVAQFVRHRRREVVEAFALLARRDNGTLKQVLHDPHHAAFVAMVDALANSTRAGVMRLVLSFLNDPHIPSAIVSVLGKRADPKFVALLLRKTGHEPSTAVKRVFKRIRSIAWLSRPEEVLDQLDDDAQHGAVRLVMLSSVPRQEAFLFVKYLLVRGKPGGRREAAVALAEFSGAEANHLAMSALDDPDPQVQANVLAHLRRRGIPGVLPRLVKMADIPHDAVRNAVRDALEEFTFRRYLGAFDMLDDDVRRSTGMLVKKIDPHTLPLLREELESAMRTRRLRGLAIARMIEVVQQLDDAIIGLLGDEDALVRMEAAEALAQSSSRASRFALERALRDSSVTVQATARKSLNQRSTPRSRSDTLPNV